jgi:hypothetical protein
MAAKAFFTARAIHGRIHLIGVRGGNLSRWQYPSNGILGFHQPRAGVAALVPILVLFALYQPLSIAAQQRELSDCLRVAIPRVHETLIRHQAEPQRGGIPARVESAFISASKDIGHRAKTRPVWSFYFRQGDGDDAIFLAVLVQVQRPAPKRCSFLYAALLEDFAAGTNRLRQKWRRGWGTIRLHRACYAWLAW